MAADHPVIAEGRGASSRSRRAAILHVSPAILLILVLLALWEAFARFGGISPRTLPAPSAIASATIENWPELMQASAVTAYEGLVGFLIAIVIGILAGVCMYRWKTLRNSTYPLLAAAQTIPLITIAPLFVIWFGFEPRGKIVITAVFALFPIAIQTLRGMRSVPRFYADVALTCGATRFWTLWHVTLRVAARQIFTGLRVSAAYVFATAATAEYLGARNGLGIWLQAAFNSFRTPLIFSATLVIVVLTALLLAAISLCERLMIGPGEENE
ncbi:ABC transporter permease [Bifidobacterium psychraerophilum]|uniref:ABC transporter permease n=1 Tax=Bifidobacterium psychraerophilum TaxID=218140 RepID=UPI00333E23A0